jgi:hypothetical protein
MRARVERDGEFGAELAGALGFGNADEGQSLVSLPRVAHSPDRAATVTGFRDGTDSHGASVTRPRSREKIVQGVRVKNPLAQRLQFRRRHSREALVEGRRDAAKAFGDQAPNQVEFTFLNPFL